MAICNKKMKGENFIDSILPLTQQLNVLHQRQLDWAITEGQSIVKQGIRDIHQVEKVAEMLLQSALFGKGLEDFRAFMRYQWLEVDKVMAGEYILLYKEWIEE
jgi:virulence-associated protein VapD